MMHEERRGTKGILGAALGLVLIAVLAVGGLVGFRALTEDDGSDRTTAGATVAPTPDPLPSAAPSTAAPSSAPPSASPSASASASASPSAAETGPGSKTIDPALQAAAERITARNNAALVALDIRNGEILAVTEQATSLSGNLAPGSTFKIVTTALLLNKGAVTPNTPVPCPATAFSGKPWKNMNDYANPGATFKTDFAMSCNTAFVGLQDKITNTELSAFSTEYFGLNSNAWTVRPGLATTDGVVPPAVSDVDKVAQMLGQGELKMNPMTMASVTATAITGQFRQPITERGGPVHTAPRKLTKKVSDDIRNMMVACATTGTAKSVFAGMNGVGAKTGTAEVGAGTNAWMVAYRGNIAVAVVVQGGTSGAGDAGPVVRAFLDAVPAGR
ncbi:penicillin-binding transpeptidase domain-containing protein [Yinghuangia soli]|uniref:Penicillin-binding protein transpeptidase domain-containing protein n=1 Tax=Yinghuangia soli TaxID=2908204 RepID=A0AA41PY42_9ACTN|nr:penicillin-binding transpeptidase domain-containing protein [Yinghuangia soli]MCF2527980.1 hypothetical protein [Yinghuangia soli]